MPNQDAETPHTFEAVCRFSCTATGPVKLDTLAEWLVDACRLDLDTESTVAPENIGEFALEIDWDTLQEVRTQ